LKSKRNSKKHFGCKIVSMSRRRKKSESCDEHDHYQNIPEQNDIKVKRAYYGGGQQRGVVWLTKHMKHNYYNQNTDATEEEQTYRLLSSSEMVTPTSPPPSPINISEASGSEFISSSNSSSSGENGCTGYNQSDNLPTLHRCSYKEDGEASRRNSNFPYATSKARSTAPCVIGWDDNLARPIYESVKVVDMKQSDPPVLECLIDEEYGGNMYNSQHRHNCEFTEIEGAKEDEMMHDKTEVEEQKVNVDPQQQWFMKDNSIDGVVRCSYGSNKRKVRSNLSAAADSMPITTLCNKIIVDNCNKRNQTKEEIGGIKNRTTMVTTRSIAKQYHSPMPFSKFEGKSAELSFDAVPASQGGGLSFNQLEASNNNISNLCHVLDRSNNKNKKHVIKQKVWKKNDISPVRPIGRVLQNASNAVYALISHSTSMVNDNKITTAEKRGMLTPSLKKSKQQNESQSAITTTIIKGSKKFNARNDGTRARSKQRNTTTEEKKNKQKRTELQVAIDCSSNATANTDVSGGAWQKQPSGMTSLSDAKAFFEQLDSSHVLTVRSDSMNSSCSSEQSQAVISTTSRRLLTCLTYPSLRTRYREYCEISIKSGIDPIPMDEFMSHG